MFNIILFLFLVESAIAFPVIDGHGLPDFLDSLLPGLLHPGPDSGSGSSPVPGAGQAPDIPEYTLLWSDEFPSQPQSSEETYLPSSANWLFDIGTSYPSGAPAWGNNELQYYTSSKDNIRVTEEGILQITPRLSPSSPDEEPELEGRNWTSSRIETASTFSAPESGKLYIEAKLKTGCAPTSNQAGIWPAFWALGETFRRDPTYWPMASEWDLMEVINGQPTVYNTLHCGIEEGEGGPCNEYTGLGNGGVWHVVGFEVDRSTSSEGNGWEEETLKWYIDNQQTHSVSGADVGDEEVWERIAHDGHFLLLNVAVGGDWPGDPEVDGEVALEVDYVRVYTSAPAD